ncbi:hypothetical protein L917_20710 [Phytophthora nicotianae]|uniref:Uncharacterized protein n=1 Tax=Phytophthora nicotianae TaxID=4792 RepID=W2JZY9_PHYNI|nr:hypothetical protein L917_20710 [Phytophthora nicotianae]
MYTIQRNRSSTTNHNGQTSSQAKSNSRSPGAHGSTATVRLSTPPHATVQASASTARRRQVGVNEYTAGAPGEWLRQAVVGVSNGNYVTGQVIRYNGNFVTIRTLFEFSVPINEDHAQFRAYSRDFNQFVNSPKPPIHSGGLTP